MQSEHERQTWTELEVRPTASPNLQQLAGRHARLERELARAFGMQPWPGALIDRLADELLETAHEIEKHGGVAA